MPYHPNQANQLGDRRASLDSAAVATLSAVEVTVSIDLEAEPGIILGVSVRTTIRPELGHSIDLEGMRLGATFITDMFHAEPKSNRHSTLRETASVKLQ